MRHLTAVSALTRNHLFTGHLVISEASEHSLQGLAEAGSRRAANTPMQAYHESFDCSVSAKFDSSAYRPSSLKSYGTVCREWQRQRAGGRLTQQCRHTVRHSTAAVSAIKKVTCSQTCCHFCNSSESVCRVWQRRRAGGRLTRQSRRTARRSIAASALTRTPCRPPTPGPWLLGRPSSQKSPSVRCSAILVSRNACRKHPALCFKALAESNCRPPALPYSAVFCMSHADILTSL